MATAITSIESLNRVRTAAESIKSDLPQRFPEAASIGDTFRQGDIYIQLLQRVPASWRKASIQNPQLAPGTSKGSRHILDSLRDVTIYEKTNANAITGPIIHIFCQRTITHPEHGDVILPPGIYKITYQRAFVPPVKRSVLTQGKKVTKQRFVPQKRVED
ncbi:MAG: hypothetical protein CMJ19_19200 [Phycisphaeraceae bacterium]|nr:hypothetical protein [Phycisphaeraceae bacterium]